MRSLALLGNNERISSIYPPYALKRINASLGFGTDEYHQAVAKSFLVSCDNAHAVHPNHPELYDPTNRTFMNKGIVIKEAANQKYTN